MGRRAAARLAWSLAGLSLLLCAASIVLYVATGSVQPPSSWGTGGYSGVLIFLLPFLAFPLVGALIASKRPENPIGWICLAVGIIWMIMLISTYYGLYGLVARPGSVPFPAAIGSLGEWMWVLAVGMLGIYLILLFPDGRLPSRRWRPLAWLSGAVIILASAGFALSPGPMDGLPGIRNPFGLEQYPWVADATLGVMLLLPLCILASAVSLVLRFLHSGGEQRAQIKWLAFAASILGLGISSYVIPANILSDDAGGVDRLWVNLLEDAVTLSYAGVPVAVGIAILRYRLYEIDVVINRTLVYGALTVCVVSIYVLVVGYLGALFQTGGNLLISLLATGVVAVLFQPLRDRLQRAVNRLMYGERDDPYAVVSRLGQRLETVLAPDDVLPTIVETVREALKLPYAAITLPRDNGFEVAAASGEPPADPLRLPLSYQGEAVGELLLGPRAPGEEFSAADRRLLNDLAHHAGVAVHGVRVMEDLRRSRERLVLAREEERRRLRRDLHDELAPTLAALGLATATVGELISTDTTKALALNAELQTEIRSTVGEVRRLVYDLRPPTLDELGLTEAIRQRAARYNASKESGGLQITVEASGLPPELPAAVEVAAYRIVQEALMNVVRHAGAGTCAVRLACPESQVLEVEIVDDGVGLPQSPEFGVGLRSMHERATELGGVCQIDRASPTGTRVFARLPLDRRSVQSEKE